MTFALRNLIPHDPWKRNQLAVTVSAGFIFSGFTLIMPFVPMYVQMLGVRTQAAAAIWAGIALGISPLVASLAAEPPFTPRHAGCPRSARFLGRVPAARAGYASGRSGGRALVAARCAV